MEHLIGTEIKGYELLELIGAGGFGAVYRAHQQSVGREVAIKVILPEHANTPMFIRRFETEAQLVARLEHPYIVPLYDFWRGADGAYIVMRYVRGGNLTRLIKEDGPLSLERAGRLLAQISSALAIAHANGIVHRDLKPDNILLDESDNHYLTDFGIAKDIRADADLNLTQAGTIIGSPAYLSPEQITGSDLTPLSDVYSLGILLHYVLTGEHPFRGKTPTAMLVHQIQDTMPPLQMKREGIPDELDEVLQRATAKDPESRYQSVIEMAVAFNEAVARDESHTLISTGGLHTTISGLDPAQFKNPYKGLKAFEEADAQDFYGRDALTQRLIDRLAPDADMDSGDHLLVIVGPSGSGKSSVIKAGLLPLLRKGAIPNSDNWFYTEMVPGAHPVEELEAALLRVAVNPPGSLLQQLVENERGLVRALKRILPDDETELVLFIDQFEEVFTLTEREADRQHFLNSLLIAITEPRNRLRLIITLRADFYDRPLSYHEFGEMVRNYTEVVLPLGPQELEAAIIQPARYVGVALEDGLVSAIVGDVREQPGALPLMQYALTQLFEQREGNYLTLAAYNNIGRAMGALAQRAEEIYRGLHPEQQDIARQLFLRLVTLGEGKEDTRRRIIRSELNALGNADVMQTVIDTFGNQRLLTFDNDPQTREPTIEVAHEALIREWGSLRDWLDSAREELRTHRRLNHSMREWKHAKEDASYLATGARLDQFDQLQRTDNIAINAEEARYLKASLHQREARLQAEQERLAREEALEERAQQRLRALVSVMTLAAIVAIALAGFAFRAQQQAINSREAAEAAALVAESSAAESNAVALAANAITLIDDFRPTLALNLALEASSRRPELIPVQQSLSQAAYAPAALAQLNPLDDYALISLAFNSDGSQIAGGSVNGKLFIIDTHNYSVLHDIDAHEGANDDGNTVPTPIHAVAYSPTAARIATGDNNGQMKLWDASTGELIREFAGHSARVTDLQFTPDGNGLLSGSEDTTMVLWDVASGDVMHEFEGHVGRVLSLDLTVNGRIAVSSTSDSPDDSSVIDRDRARVGRIER